jgi:hypothetical protein
MITSANMTITETDPLKRGWPLTPGESDAIKILCSLELRCDVAIDRRYATPEIKKAEAGKLKLRFLDAAYAEVRQHARILSREIVGAISIIDPASSHHFLNHESLKFLRNIGTQLEE